MLENQKVYVQEFRISFAGKIGRDRKMKNHSITLKELPSDESGAVCPIALESVKEDARTYLKSVKEFHSSSVSQLKSNWLTREVERGYTRTTFHMFSEKNKTYTLN